MVVVVPIQTKLMVVEEEVGKAMAEVVAVVALVDQAFLGVVIHAFLKNKNEFVRNS